MLIELNLSDGMAMVNLDDIGEVAQCMQPFTADPLCCFFRMRGDQSARVIWEPYANVKAKIEKAQGVSI